MAYDALDNRAKAIDLREQLILEKADILSTMEYNEATAGEYWTFHDSEHVEIEMQVIARLISALHNYIGREDEQ
jgi:hypothetical protein